MDTASNVTLLTERVAKALNLEGSLCELNLNGIGEKNTKCQSALVDFDISEPGKPSNSHRLEKVQVVPIISDDVWACDWSSQFPKGEIPFNSPFRSGRIDLLIGLDHIDLLLVEKAVKLNASNKTWKRGMPIALKTILGWTCSARIKGQINPKSAFMSDYRNGLENIPSFCKPVCQEKKKVTFSNDHQDDLISIDSFRSDKDESSTEEGSGWSKKLCKQMAKSFALMLFEPVYDGKQIPEYNEENFTLLTQEDRRLELLYQNAVRQMEDIMSHQDSFPADSTVTKEEEYARKLLEDTFVVKDGRAYISPIWKPGQPEEGLNNYAYALGRLKSVVNKLSPENFNVIDRIFEDYLEKGITVEVTHLIKDPYNEDSIYWPNFPVYQPKSETTPVRPVMDGKAKCLDRNTKSINDKCFLAGPNLLCNLTQVLNGFRQYNVAFTGDISKMFLKILAPPKDRKYARFLWQDKFRKDVIRTFEFVGQLFGNVGSPTAAIMAVQLNAKKYMDKFPRAVQTIIEKTIMDDHLDSFPTWEEALEVLKAILHIHKAIGLDVTKISTNSKEVYERLPKEATQSKNMIDFEKYHTPDIEYAPGTEPKIPTMRTLGQYWDMVHDLFSYRQYDPDDHIKWTKVLCLSQAHKIFDPLGYAIPVLLESKLILRQIFINHPGWKADQINDEELQRWQKWLVNLPQFPQLKFPRVLMPGLPKTFKSVTYHVFADASKEAFCAVAYVRVEYNDGKVYTNFLQSRSKLTQKKPVRTIPKNELLGIELASDLALHAIVPFKALADKVTIWSDSKTALQWVRMNINHLAVFCHNYVKKITDRFTTEQIRWVPGVMNPADLGTRPMTVPELLTKQKLWREGPEFLKQDEKHWPSLPELEKNEDVLQEVKKEFKYFTYLLHCPKQLRQNPEINLLEAKWYSSFASMLRIVSHVVRFIDIVRQRILARKRGEDMPALRSSKKRSKLHLYPAPRYLLEAEARIIYIDQQLYLKADIERCSKQRGFPLKRKMSNLSPELVEYNGLDLGPTGIYHLRLTGRIKSATHLKDRMKRPYVISHEGPLSKMLIRHYHENVLKHAGGPKCLQCEIHRAYWITGSINAIKRQIRECVTCRKRKPRASVQKMAPLPDIRIPGAMKEEIAPFQHVALDAAGHFFVTLGEGRGHKKVKRWFIVIRDLLYGGIYLDVLRRMTADSFLCTLQRFCSERCVPKYIVCDNGTNFTKGQKEHSRMWDEIDKRDLVSKRPEITWDFTPPEAPYMNGAAERMVGAAKSALKMILTEDVLLNDETFITTLKFVQRTLNDRPIAYTETDSQDPESLTPNHFLMQGNLASDLAPVDETFTLEKRYQYILFLKNKFWSRLVKELTPTLRKCDKWRGKRPEIQVGDVVVILDEESYRDHQRYPLGRVLEIKPSGADGIPRSALIKVAKGPKKEDKLIRGLNKLHVVLPARDLVTVDVPVQQEPAVPDPDDVLPAVNVRKRHKRNRNRNKNVTGEGPSTRTRSKLILFSFSKN